MPRARSTPASRKKRKRILKQARGFRGGRHRLLRTAKESVDKAMQHAYVGRKQKKQQYRQLWIARISAACKVNNITYSRLINGLNIANINLNRKMLSEIAIFDPEGFKTVTEKAKTAL
jgi:large subunit ribosomal protein L20